MKKTLIFILPILLFTGFVSAQQTISLTFTAIDSASYIQPDSIKVMNRTRDCDTVLHWNDTVLVLNVSVGVPAIDNLREGFAMKNFPNPVIDHAVIELILPEPGQTALMVTDAFGRNILNLKRDLQSGLHTFDFTPGNASLYFVTAVWNGYRKSIKVVNASPNKSQQCTLSYTGNQRNNSPIKSFNGSESFVFEPGDELLYVGYIDALESGILDVPDSNRLYTFQFAYGIPCPETPTVTYEGQIYNTVQIFSHCWLKENLNVGEMIPGSQEMEDDGEIEKYCYDDDPANCDTYGGLYPWNELMGYVTTEGAQGICPVGWHIPTDEEWKILEGTVDSQYGVGDPKWDEYDDWRGLDAGKKLKSTTGWNGGGNGTDDYGFSALPGGFRSYYGYFDHLGINGHFWSSTEPDSNYAWYRLLKVDYDDVYRNDFTEKIGFSFRCLKDRTPTSAFVELSFTAIDSMKYIPLESIKIMNLTQGGDTVLYYPDTIVQLKYSLSQSIKLYAGFNYELGDTLLFIGYTGILESGILDVPDSNRLYTFQFAYDIPCLETPTVTYEGQIYNTVQIFSQCWLKENLNVGEMIPGSQEMEDDGEIEKYCFDDDPANCAIYGGLYQWNELMGYVTTEGAQGICPDGWHIPTDGEWKILEGLVDSQYGVGHPEWDNGGYRGEDAGKKLKSTSGWNSGGNGTDDYGFYALPGAYRHSNGNFHNLGYYTLFWSATESDADYAWLRRLSYVRDVIYRDYNHKEYGYSGRCLRDY